MPYSAGYRKYLTTHSATRGGNAELCSCWGYHMGGEQSTPYSIIAWRGGTEKAGSHCQCEMHRPLQVRQSPDPAASHRDSAESTIEKLKRMRGESHPKTKFIVARRRHQANAPRPGYLSSSCSNDAYPQASAVCRAVGSPLGPCLMSRAITTPCQARRGIYRRRVRLHCRGRWDKWPRGRQQAERRPQE